MSRADEYLEAEAAAGREMRESLAAAGSELVRTLNVYGEALRRHVSDPERDELAAAYRTARDDHDAARSSFDDARKGAAASRTRKVNEAWEAVAQPDG